MAVAADGRPRCGGEARERHDHALQQLEHAPRVPAPAEAGDREIKGTVTLVAAYCEPRLVGSFYLGGCVDYAEDDELAPLVPGVRAATWAVNGQVGGGPATGTIKAGKGSAVFTAPAKKPA